MLLQSIKAVNMLVLLPLLGCALYSMCVHSETPPGHTQGALTVVEEPASVEEEDGVVTVEDNGEVADSTPLKQKVFHPTKEWKTVKKDETVPAGLHIRMNLQTGEREARLMEDDQGVKYWETGDHRGMVNADKKSFSREELKRALKDFKSNVDGGGQDVKNAEEVKKKFKSYNELKEDFEKINMAIKTDSEIITDLIERFKKVGSDLEAKKIVLEELEYHLHKIDNAVLFCDQGGMSLLVTSLNDTDTHIQAESALVLGAALQSNPKVQISALEHGAMHHLLTLLSTSASSNVQKRSLYALSSLVRHFPFAQKKFLHLGGLSALKKLFQDSSLKAQKLQVKALTLLNDLLVEKELSEKHTRTDNSVEVERFKQYQEVDLSSSMQEGGWCELIPELLEVQDHDAREKVLQAMLTLSSKCQSDFSQAVRQLKKLETEYKALAIEEKEEGDGDDYFSSLVSLVSSMLTSVQTRDEL